MDDLERLEIQKGNLRKLLDKLYGTSSVTAEANYTEDLIKLVKQMDRQGLIEYAKTLDIFSKCVLHYRLPIDFRLDVGLVKATEVSIEDRLAYWKDYKTKLKEMKKGPEEEYDKIILMACTLHVPIEDENVETNGASENSERTEDNVSEENK